MSSLQTRPVTFDDLDTVLALSVEAYGALPDDFVRPERDNYPYPGRHTWGTFDGARLVARVMGREYHSWFHGVPVATCGIASVAVATEERGQGLLDPLFVAVLTEARGRGEVISGLYPTAPGIYRRFGYEIVTTYDEVSFPTARLAAIPAEPGVTLRRAVEADFDAVRELYDTWAAGLNGPLTRRGASFPADAPEWLAGFTGVSLAFVDDRLAAFAAWDRGRGYDSAAVISVHDFVSLNASATRALWRLIGTFSAVTGSVRLTTSGQDVARLALPFADWPIVKSVPYMLRIDDVVGALTGLRLPGAGSVAFDVAGDLLESANGSYTLSVSDGVSTCEPSQPANGSPVLAPRGLALLFAGAQSCSSIRAAGLLTGGSPTTDLALDGFFGARTVQIRDYY